MKRKLFLTLIAAMCLLVFSVGVFAATNLFSVGKTSNNNLVEISSTGILSGVRASYEVTATGDTLTAVESGKTIILTGSTSRTFTLPSASLGLAYTFIQSSTCTLNVDPNSSDTIAYLALGAGDKISSAGATGDSISLICGAANTWYIANMEGTWTDGGA